MKATELRYLNDTYLFRDKSILLDIKEDENGKYCILDSTIFYPQGGGQPTDIGKIIINNNEIDIHFVAFSNGIVKHYGNFDNLNKDDLIGKEVDLIVDKNNRILNAKSHTAGHLVSAVVESISNLIGVKGYHFLNGSYVEFDGSKPDNIEDFITIVNNKLKQEVNNGTSIATKIVSKNELLQLCKHVPDFLPDDKPIRIMKFENFDPIPCGGTHLKSLNELENVEITKVKSKKGRIRISYTFL